MGSFKPFSYKAVQIFIAILIPNAGGFLIYWLLMDKIAENEKKDQIEPSYAPPGWVVLIAWTTLYTLGGIASWRVWTKRKTHNVKIPLLIYFIKLLLNWLWSLIAFGLDNLLFAIIEMSILLIFVIITGVLFYKVDKPSGLVYIPYAIYLSYATVLCIHIYILNY